MKPQRSPEEREKSTKQGPPLVPEMQAIRAAVPDRQYGHASGGAFVELNRKTRRKYAIT